MTIKQYLVGSLIVLALLAGAIVFNSHVAFGASNTVPGTTLHLKTQDSEYQNFYTFFNATTTNATSTNTGGTGDGTGWLNIVGAQDVIFYFTRTGINGNQGSTQFRVQVTPDGVNWYEYPELGQVAISTTDNAFYTRSGTSSISSTSTQQWAMEDISYYAVRCIAIKTTDGEATCSATATYHQ